MLGKVDMSDFMRCQSESGAKQLLGSWKMNREQRLQRPDEIVEPFLILIDSLMIRHS